MVKHLVTLVNGAASSPTHLFPCSADHLPMDEWVSHAHIQQLHHSTVWFEEDDPKPSSLLSPKATASLCSACRWHPDVISQGDENTFICAYRQSTQLQKNYPSCKKRAWVVELKTECVSERWRQVISLPCRRPPVHTELRELQWQLWMIPRQCVLTQHLSQYPGLKLHNSIICLSLFS